MPRHLTETRLRAELIELVGPQIHEFNNALHQDARELLHALNHEYLAIRNARFGRETAARYPIGLYIAYEAKSETHTNLELGYIRWRYGRFSVNKSRAPNGRAPVTMRVRKSSRTQLHYYPRDFAAVPLWSTAPEWERRLVLRTEEKARPLREALRAHEDAQRAYLYAPVIPRVDPSFHDFM